MLQFLVQRPIAVLMTILGLVVVGLVVSQTLPISLLPEIPIPQLTIQISHPNTTARDLENTIVQPLRNQLLQVGKLKDIQSNTRDNIANIQLEFEFGTNINYAFIEANEKIDQIITRLPRDLERPRVIKTNISDIPVFQLSIVPKKEYKNGFIELGEFAQSIIKRRIEQLKEVAFVDRSGYAQPQIQILPLRSVLQSLKMTEQDLERILQQQNIDLGSILMQDGQYQYNVRFLSNLKSKKDIENIVFNKGGQIFRLKDLATIEEVEQTRRGRYLYNGKEGIVFSVRKQANAQLYGLQESFDELLVSFRKDYPQLDFFITNDQTKILKVSIQNLQTSLLYGSGFAMLVIFIFFRNWKSPLLIAISIPVSLIVSLFGFYLLGLSINIISLSGLILGVGLMIDNSIIIIENIQQKQKGENNVLEATTQGANEVIRPLISSALTTCSVFLPLIFLSGLSGALFYDQALSITIALGSSLLVAYFLLPTLLYLFRQKKGSRHIKSKNSFHFYTKSVDVVLRFRWMFLILTFIGLSGIYFLGVNFQQETFPNLTKKGLTVEIDWNEPLTIQHSEKRVLSLLSSIEQNIVFSNVFLGEQQFLLETEHRAINEVFLFLEVNSTTSIEKMEEVISKWLKENYVLSTIKIEPVKHVFDEVFATDAAPLVLNIQSVRTNKTPSINEVEPIYNFFTRNSIEVERPTFQEQSIIKVRKEKALRYDIPLENIYKKLSSIFGQNKIGVLQFTNQFTPIVIGNDQIYFKEKLKNTFVKNQKGEDIPLKDLIVVSKTLDYKNIQAGKSGEVLSIEIEENNPNLVPKLKKEIQQLNNLSAYFSGQIFEDRQNIQELNIILLISILLLYLILAAQFESLVQPFIVIFTVPIGILGAFILLCLTGQSLNIISIIGLIVMSGIVVNDAILKVDMMNKLSLKMPLINAIHLAGIRRIKPILMTSITTILALIPILLSAGLGAELQKPLAYAVIGGLTFGTLASLYLIPILYWLFKK